MTSAYGDMVKYGDGYLLVVPNWVIKDLLKPAPKKKPRDKRA